MNRIPYFLLTIAIPLAAACGGNDTQTPPNTPVTTTSPATAKKDIVDTAVAAGSFTKLAAALKAAGLVDTLKGPGPFTVFAPTDDAFAKIPQDKLDALLKDKVALGALLKAHVVSGKVMAADVTKMTSATTLNGTFPVNASADGVMIGNAKVIKTDIECSNGVIHVIDTVIMPDDKATAAAPAKLDLLGTAEKAGNFNTLAKLVGDAGLADTLKGPGPFTIFAPTDEAFAKIDKKTLDALAADKTKLAAVLKYHVVAGRVMAADVAKMKTAKTVNGKEAKITVDKSGVMVDKAKVVTADIECSNGVIHVIDSVLTP
ncbi:hypothetical protein BH09MYX1_BH09MYX1_23380 [soil metagenome]